MTPQVIVGAFSLSATSPSTATPYNRRRLDICPPYPTNDDEPDNEQVGGSSSVSSVSSFSFGIIADVQWADTDDGYNYAKTVKRCYRGAFTTLQNAIKYWNEYNSRNAAANSKISNGSNNGSNNNSNNQQLQFIAQLGDLIDGINSKVGTSDTALDLALEQLDLVKPYCPSVNLIGNHELYNFNRQQLSSMSSVSYTATTATTTSSSTTTTPKKWLQNGDSEYYSFIPQKGWRIIVLDPYQISIIGYSNNMNDPRRIYAADWVTKENPNVSSDGSSGDWFDNIEGYQRRFCPYNGGYGTEQLEWLENELNDSIEKKERVIIMSHVIIHPKACGGGTMAWDYDQALDIIYKASVASEEDVPDRSSEANGSGNDDNNKTEKASVVVAVLCGHDHKGNYYNDEYGIHHCTFQSPLNKGTDGYAYGIMKVLNNEDCLEIHGPNIDDLLPNVNERPEAMISTRTTSSSTTTAESIDERNNEFIRLPVRPISPSTTSTSSVPQEGEEEETITIVEVSKVMETSLAR